MRWEDVYTQDHSTVVSVCVFPSTEMLDESIPCNVVAAADGYIVRIEAYEGAAKVKVGDSVVKGDLLISGVRKDCLFKKGFWSLKDRTYQ